MTRLLPIPGPCAPRSRDRGLTLVELVAMLLVVALLAAVALPRLADQQTRAREARLRGLASSLQAVADLVHAAARAQGVDCAAASATLRGTDPGDLALSHCQPQALASFGNGILAAAKVGVADGWVPSQSGDGAAPGARLVLEAADAPDPTGCALTYTVPSAAGRRATIALTVAGC